VSFRLTLSTSEFDKLTHYLTAGELFVLQHGHPRQTFKLCATTTSSSRGELRALFLQILH